MANRFQKLREEYSEKRKDENPKAKIYSQREMYEEMTNAGFNVSLSKIKKIESDTYGVEVDAETLRAYKWKFNVSADWLIDETVTTKRINGSIASASKLTGLTDEAIDTLIKLKSNKYYNQHKFDYALHTLNLILANYDSANFFELIYHFLFGNYETMGHYDKMGQVVYDGSEVFIADRYNANKMTIDSAIVNKAVLQLITQQLEYWKTSLKDKDDNYGKILPSKEKLEQEIKQKYEYTEQHIQNYLLTKDKYISQTKQTPVDFESLYYKTKALITMENVLNYNYEEIKKLNIPLKEIYNAKYRKKNIDDFLENL